MESRDRLNQRIFFTLWWLDLTYYGQRKQRPAFWNSFSFSPHATDCHQGKHFSCERLLPPLFPGFHPLQPPQWCTWGLSPLSVVCILSCFLALFSQIQTCSNFSHLKSLLIFHVLSPFLLSQSDSWKEHPTLNVSSSRIILACWEAGEFIFLGY